MLKKKKLSIRIHEYLEKLAFIGIFFNVFHIPSSIIVWNGNVWVGFLKKLTKRLPSLLQVPNEQIFFGYNRLYVQVMFKIVSAHFSLFLNYSRNGLKYRCVKRRLQSKPFWLTMKDQQQQRQDNLCILYLSLLSLPWTQLLGSPFLQV